MEISWQSNAMTEPEVSSELEACSKYTDCLVEGRLSAKAPNRTLQNLEQVTYQAWI